MHLQYYVSGILSHFMIHYSSLKFSPFDLQLVPLTNPKAIISGRIYRFINLRTFFLFILFSFLQQSTTALTIHL